MSASTPNTYPLIPLDYGTVLFPGKTLHISPIERPDVAAIIAEYYSGSLKSKLKDGNPTVACVPLRPPHLAPDGKKLLEDGQQKESPLSVAKPGQATSEDLFGYGCIATTAGIRGGWKGQVALVVDGFQRCRLGKINKEAAYFEAQIEESKDEVDVSDPAVKAAFSNLKELSQELFKILRVAGMTSNRATMSPLLMRQLEAFVARKDISEASLLADFMSSLGTSYQDKLQVLAATSVVVRLQRANELLQNQISSLQGNTQIITVTNDSRDNFDVEKFRELQRRYRSGNIPASGGTGNIGFRSMPPGMGGPGQGDDDGNEVEELKKRLDEAGLTAEAQKVASRELKRLQKMNPAQAEYSVIRNYLENLAEVPWNKFTEDRLDKNTLARARKQLDDDHYGLEKIKKRLLEYLAVLKLKQSANAELDAQIEAIREQKAIVKKPEQNETDLPKEPEKEPSAEGKEQATLEKKRMLDKSPILLLVGPPGTGKTSLAKSVAMSLGRKFHRISLGGVRDEAEIRGHRRTYVAAMPGLIVSGLKKTGVGNPVFLVDEIDKVGTSNFHGDPSAAMLEVLDPEQNHTFSDHYINIPIDLSKVLFIATANTLDTIPPPLLDRMETITLSGYTTLEKRHIATRHLIPKQIMSNGLQSSQIQLADDVVDKIITSYTRESGVRNLEREIGSVCRHKAVQYADQEDNVDSTASVSPSTSDQSSDAYDPLVSVDDLEPILGIERFTEEVASSADPPRPGIVTGLVAFSSLSQGSILFIEVQDMPGTGRVQLTGKLGDVLKESVEVAMTWVKAHAFEFGLSSDPSEDFMAKRNVHVHCPAGAVPKDGPSAGLAHTVALVSLFSSKPVPPKIAMTGEVSLRGKVMPVGGLKEKLIGAHRAGVETVLLPEANRKEVKDVPQEVQENMNIVFVDEIRKALQVVWPDERWRPRWEVESRL
ncbi:MAG: hypothetical protein M1831_006591 [Alyxoria varia]|nr:MAG: hypothetical protein M1831_006591 [Alyxoria varia]